jgi:hypothetical protein
MYAPQTSPIAAHPGFLAPIPGGAQLAGFGGQTIGGLFGQPLLGGQPGQILGGPGNLLPFQLAGHLPFQPLPVMTPVTWQLTYPVGGQPGQVLGGVGNLLPFQATPLIPAGAWQPTYPVGAQLPLQWPYGGILPSQLAGHLPFQHAPVMASVA